MAGRRGFRRRLRLLIALTLPLVICFSLLPYDSTLRRAVTFSLDKKIASFINRREDWAWVDGPQLYPVNLAKDVVVIVKTGYGTKDRVKAWLEAVDSEGEGGIGVFEHVSVVGDFATKDGEHFTYRGRPMAVQDMVSRTLSTVPPEALTRSDRRDKHAKLTSALEKNVNTEAAEHLSKEYGWELDAMKFVSSLETAFAHLPTKKWYVLVDDDTYLLQSSLATILSQLDPSAPHFLGNAVGDFRTRFGHGGSGLVFSRGALDSLFRSPGGAAMRAHAESLAETWGDRLIARALLRLNVRLDERRALFFSGEPPHLTRIRPDRFCAPIASFHHLSVDGPQQASDAVRQRRAHAVRWVEIWDMFGKVEFGAFEREPVRKGWDHVGSVEFDDRGDSGPVKGVEDVEGCRKVCEERQGGKGCLAWTWDEKRGCKVAGWMVPGVGEGNEGMSTGINVKWATELAGRCI